MRKLNPEELKLVYGGGAKCDGGGKGGSKSGHSKSQHSKSKHSKSSHGKSSHSGHGGGCGPAPN